MRRRGNVLPALEALTDFAISSLRLGGNTKMPSSADRLDHLARADRAAGDEGAIVPPARHQVGRVPAAPLVPVHVLITICETSICKREHIGVSLSQDACRRIR